MLIGDSILEWICIAAGLLIPIISIVVYISILVKRKYKASVVPYIVLFFLTGILVCGFAKYFDPVAGQVYPNVNVGSYILGGLSDSLKLFVFQMDFEVLNAFRNTHEVIHRLYVAGYLTLSAVCLCSLMVMAISVFVRSFRPKIANFFLGYDAVIFTDEFSDIALDLALSFKNDPKEKKTVVVVISEISQLTDAGSEFKNTLASHKIDMHVADLTESYISRYLKKHRNIIKTLFRKNKKVVIYAAYTKESDNISFANKALNTLKKCYKKCLNSANDNLLEAYNCEPKPLKRLSINIVRWSEEYQESKSWYTESHGHISTISMSESTAQNFVFNHPLINFFSSQEIEDIKNYKKAPNVHVHFFGFGTYNKELFKNMVPIYQINDFNHVRYHVVTKDDSADVISYGLLKNETKEGFPVSPYLFDIDQNKVDLENELEIFNYVSSMYKKYKDDIHIFIASTGNQVLNSFAISKAKEYFTNQNRVTRIGYYVLTNELPDQDAKDNTNTIIRFGSLTEFQRFTYDNNNYIQLIAAYMNSMYGKSIEEIKEALGKKTTELDAWHQWYNLDYLTKIKNINPVLSFPSKLALLGYRLVSEGNTSNTRYSIESITDSHKVSEEEFYQEGGLISKIIQAKTNLNFFSNKQKDISQFASKEFKKEFVDALTYKMEPQIKALLSMEHLRFVATDIVYLHTKLMSYEEFIKNPFTYNETKKRIDVLNKIKGISNMTLCTSESLWEIPSKIFTPLVERYDAKSNSFKTGLKDLDEHFIECYLKVEDLIIDSDIKGMQNLYYLINACNR